MNTIANKSEVLVNAKFPFLWIFSLCIVLNLNVFFPTLSSINLWDEAFYVHQGYLLLHEGFLPELAQAPLLAGMYSIIISVFADNPHWMIIAISVARGLFFTLFWLGILFLLKYARIETQVVWIFLLLLLFWNSFEILLANSSDALFTVLMTFSLSSILIFRANKDYMYIYLAFLFIGLGILVRNDGWTYLVVAGLLSVWFTMKRRLRLIHTTLSLTVALSIVGFYFIISKVFSDQPTGIGNRIYLAFEQGHGAVYTPVFGEKFKDVVGTQEEAFGTKEENGGSILTAIVRHPNSMLKRAYYSVIYRLPYLLLKAYGGTFAILLLPFAFIGLYVLIRQYRYEYFWILVLWTLPIGIYLLTFFRAGYFLFALPSAFLFCAYGLNWILSREGGKVIGILYAVYALAAGIVGILYDRPLLALGPIIIFIIIVFLASDRTLFRTRSPAVILLVFLIGFTFIGRSYSSLDNHLLKRYDPREEIVSQLSEKGIYGKAIGTSARPGVIWASGNRFVGVYNIPENDLLIFLRNQGVDYFMYDDEAYRGTSGRMQKQKIDELRNTEIFLPEISTSEGSVVIYKIQYKD